MFATLLLLSALADTHIHGVVRDSATRAPLHGAVVRLDGTRRGAIADRYGAFHFYDLQQDTALLVVSYVGYATVRVEVPLTDATRKEVRLDIQMKSTNLTGNEIQVTDERIAHSALPTQQARVLTSAEIDEHRGQTFADALTQVAGVTVLQTGPSLKKPMINGLMGTRLVLRNNNLVQEGQQWGIEHAPEIDAFSPSRITVVKGPAAVMFGPNAIGGVIDVESRPIRKDPGLHGEATVNLFSNGRQGALGAFLETAQVAGLPVAVRLQGSTRMGGDAEAPDYVLNNTGVRELNASLTMEMGDEAFGLSTVASIFSTTLGIFGGAHIGNATDMLRAIQRGNPSSTRPFSYEITNPRQEISHAMVSVKGHAELSRDERLVLTLGHQVNDRNEFDGHNVRIRGRGTDPIQRAADSISRLNQALATPAMNLVLNTSSLDASLEHALSERVRGTAGISSMWQLNERTGSVILIPDYRLWGIGAFLYESIMLHDVTISAGLRYDVRDLKARIINRATGEAPLQYRRWQNFSASIGALWNPVEDLTLTWNLASSWRPPQVNELYSNDVHHGSAYYEIGDSALASERTLGTDVGMKYEIAGATIETSAFLNRIDDYIMAVPDPANPTITVRGTFPTYRFTQMTARLFGGDLSLTVPLHDQLNVYGQASFVRGDNLDRDEPLLFIPADRGRIGLHIHADDVGPIHDAYIDVSMLGVRRQDRVVPGRDYAEPPAGYARLDLSLGGVITMPYGLPARLTLACNNLFNTAYREYLSQYRYFADDPGRNIILRFTTTF
ncbi:MAG: hypothetical protein RIR53_621 [Bacteroidota bacterium]|jgi:iron complex outermembrane receptor protein